MITSVLSYPGVITLSKCACILLGDIGKIDISPTSKLYCYQPKYQARYQRLGSPVDSVIMLIPGLILGLITTIISPPLLVLHISNIITCLYDR